MSRRDTIPVPPDVAERNRALIDPRHHDVPSGRRGADVVSMAPTAFMGFHDGVNGAGVASAVFIYPGLRTVLEIRDVRIDAPNAAAVGIVAVVALIADIQAAMTANLQELPIFDIGSGRSLRSRGLTGQNFFLPVLSGRVGRGQTAGLAASQTFLDNFQLGANPLQPYRWAPPTALWLDGRDRHGLVLMTQSVNTRVRVSFNGYEWSQRGGQRGEDA